MENPARVLLDARSHDRDTQEMLDNITRFRGKRVRNPRFTALLQKMSEVHEKKNSDYASDNPYSNFQFAAQVVGIFTEPIDQVFAVLLAVKLARIAELRKGKTPNFEGIEDSLLDLAVYASIWASYLSPVKEPKDILR